MKVRIPVLLCAEGLCGHPGVQEVRGDEGRGVASESGKREPAV